MNQLYRVAGRAWGLGVLFSIAFLMSNTAYSQTSVAPIGADSLCVGDTIRLYASSSRASGVTFTWADTSGASTISGSTGDTVSVFPSITTYFRVIGDSAGVRDTVYFMVKVNALPTVTGTASSSLVCPEDSVMFYGGGANSYAWNHGVMDSGKVRITKDTVFIVTGTDTKGCKNTDTAGVKVRMLPAVKITASSMAVCTNDTVHLSAAGAKTYAWSTSQAGLDKTGDSVWYTVNIARSYYVAGTDTNGCIGRDTVQVNHKTLPRESWNAWAGSFRTVNRACNGDQIDFKAERGNNTYTWGPSSVVSSTTGANVNATLSADQLISCKIDSSNGCSRTVSRQIFVFSAKPTVTVSFTGTGTICANGTETMTAVGAQEYLWEPSTGLDFTDRSIVKATLGATQTYKITGYSNGCLTSENKTVTVNPLPDITLSREDGNKVICRNESTVVTVTSSNGILFNWGFGVTSTAKAKSIAPGKTTNVSVTAYSAAGCANSAQIQIVVDSTCGDALGTPELSSSENIDIKSNGKNIQISLSNPQHEILELSVLDFSGKTIYVGKNDLIETDHTYDLNLGSAREGLYIVRVRTDHGLASKKIFIH